jgi:hypothetical protein
MALESFSTSADFDSAMRRFEPSRPSQYFQAHVGVLKPFEIRSTMSGRPCHGGGATAKQLPRLENRK